MEYLDLFFSAFLGTLDWTWRSICLDVPWTRNYFWGLIVISLIVYGLELLFPWRKQQAILRKDFFVDEFQISANSIAVINLSILSPLVQLLLFFVVLDFVQWVTHILMHRFSFLWKFHKVHHSVKEMGFAAHLRYHWMENIVYKPFKVIALMLMGGFQPEQAFIVHFIAISIGHLNHSNIKLDYGPFKYLFNNPIMHLYHHSKKIPNGFKVGVNFAISLSVWDYIFKTNYVPTPNKDIILGYKDDQQMPTGFFAQLFYGFKKGD